MTETTCSVQHAKVDHQQSYAGVEFPLVLKCESPQVSLQAALEWLAKHRAELNAQVQTHGAILFRGFPVHSPEDFDAFIAAFDLEGFAYENSLSNAVRVNYTPRVFSANEAPSNITIYLHHEMAQTPIFPSRLFFYCQQAAEQGGATPLCRSDVLYERIQQRFPQFAHDCETKGLRYSNVMPAVNDPASGMGRSWQSTLRAETREAAEQQLQRLGYTWEWLDDGCLRATTPILPAVREVAPGCKTFFNQLIAAFCGWKDSRNDPARAITFGDGAPLDRETVLEVARMADEMTFDTPWQAGDVAFIDNFVAMHGRRPFQGPRKVLASLVAAQQYQPLPAMAGT